MSMDIKDNGGFVSAWRAFCRDEHAHSQQDIAEFFFEEGILYMKRCLENHRDDLRKKARKDFSAGRVEQSNRKDAIADGIDEYLYPL